MVIKISRRAHPIATFLLCLYIICIFTPYITAYYLILPVLVAGAFFLVSIGDYLQNVNRNTLVLSVSLLIFASLAYRLLGISTAPLGNYAIRFMMLTSIWAGVYSWECLSKNSRKVVLVVLTLTLLVNLFDNYRIHTIYPDIYPTMKGTPYFESRWGKSNVGLTSWVYCIAIFAAGMFLVNCGNKERPFRSKLLTWALFLVTTGFVVVHGGSGTVFLSFVFIIIMVLENRILHPIARIISLMITAFVFIIIFATPVNKMLVAVIRDVSGEKVAKRFDVFGNVLTGNLEGNDEDYLVRLYYLAEDLKTWFRNIATVFFGAGYHSVIANSADDIIKLNGAGNHSGIFDIIARYGCLGLGLLTIVLKQTKRYWLKGCHALFKKRNISLIFVVLIFNSIFNNIFNYDILFLLFFLMPFYTRENEEEVGALENREMKTGYVQKSL